MADVNPILTVIIKCKQIKHSSRPAELILNMTQLYALYRDTT